jgi:two-component sensor histidine kinase
MRTADASNEEMTARPPFLTSAVDPRLVGTVVALELSGALALDSGGAFRRFLEMAQRLCNAGSAGLSLQRTNGLGTAVMRWEVVSGALAAHQGIETPRDDSPCGLCLDNAATTLLAAPERTLAHLQGVPPAICEDLIVPLYDADEVAFGTLWIAHHDVTSHFGEADVRTAERLASLLVRTMSLCTHAPLHQCALQLLESHLLEMSAAACDLAEERGRRERAEASQTKIRQALAFKEVQIKDAHHRIKNTIQLASSILQLQARKTGSVQVSAALQDGCGRLHLLAQIHELLYKSDRSEISMPQLLQAIASALEEPRAGGSPRVKLRAVCMPIGLAADDAMPLALLANEAMTNACKHAFPDGRTGEVCVTLRLIDPTVLVLQVRDDGIGLPAGATGSGLGLQLIRAFAAQLDGTLEMGAAADSTGTSLTLTMIRQQGWGRDGTASLATLL